MELKMILKTNDRSNSYARWWYCMSDYYLLISRTLFSAAIKRNLSHSVGFFSQEKLV